MNDLMPPPRRALPSRDRERIRQVLQTDRASAPDLPAQRSLVPWLAAATAATIAVGGYAVATTVGDDRGGGDVIAPAGGSDSTAPSDTSPSPEHSTPPEETPTAIGSVPPVRSMAPSVAYDRCIEQVRQTPQEPPFDDPRGRVIASTLDVTTVVVSNGTSAWACNVDPDTAVSRPVPDSPPQDVDAGTFDFAFNVASNYGDYSGDLAWAGGVLPRGVTDIIYVFPDGHAEPAVVKDGYWVMQYLSEAPWGRNANKTEPVQVHLRGPEGEQTVTVPLGSGAGCNQVTHGC